MEQRNLLAWRLRGENQKSDMKRLYDKKDRIKTINNMPKDNGFYPLL